MRAGVTKNTKDSAGRRLGVKKYGGEEIRPNQIILRQRGFRWKAGENVHFGKDHTLHSSKEGKVVYTQDPWSRRRRVIVHVVEQEIPNRKLYPPKPFMYHPELYPELAANNGSFEPLTINKDILIVQKNLATKEKKKAKEKEITVEETNKHSENFDTLSHAILNYSNTSAKKVKKHQYTSRYDVIPILNEITSIGLKYLAPDFDKLRKTTLKKEKYHFELRKNPNYKRPEDLCDTDEETIFDKIPKEYQDIELANLISKENKPLPLRDLVKKMKENNLMSKTIDTRTLPYEKGYTTKIDRLPNINYASEDFIKRARTAYLKELLNKDVLDEEDLEDFYTKNEKVAKGRITRELYLLENPQKNSKEEVKKQKEKLTKQIKSIISNSLKSTTKRKTICLLKKKKILLKK